MALSHGLFTLFCVAYHPAIQGKHPSWILNGTRGIQSQLSGDVNGVPSALREGDSRARSSTSSVRIVQCEFVKVIETINDGLQSISRFIAKPFGI